MKVKGLAQSLRDKHRIRNLTHPPQSPDLNSIEAYWNILKQRVHSRIWNSLEELKAILQEEWGKITIEEVRSRICGLPDRCKRAARTGGKAIKDAKW